jgi:hypothetical protein
MSNVKSAFSVFLVATFGLACDNGGLRSAVIQEQPSARVARAAQAPEAVAKPAAPTRARAPVERLARAVA